jgi:fused signal recognition particle receptor
MSREMRRWFRKKDRQFDDTQDEALSPQEVPEEGEPEETAPTLAQEALVAQEGQEPHLDASAPAEAVAEEGDSGGLSSETETDSAAPRRGFLRRMFRQERPLEELEPAGEEPLPAVEAPPPTPEELPELTTSGEEPIIDLEEELKEEEAAVAETRKRRFRRFRERLGRTRKSLAGGLERLFLGRREVDAEVLEELEEILITADLGVDTTLRLVEVIRDKVKRRELREADRLKEALREEMVAILTGPPVPARTARPWVMLLVGVNGVGKTTTIAKLAHQDREKGLNPLLIAADTFRAAAVEQLEIWGERVGAQVVKQKTGADPAAVVFDGLDAAQARQVDTVYVDTAGRLHTKVNLMEELKKIHRTAAKKLPGAPHETLLILDATTGQNALSQARLFHEAVGVTGVILTKLDGTAKGGMALAVAHETGLPLRYVGVGEGMDDLQPFDPEAFVAAILD